ncbi:hypothetical protein BD289DRAFT_158679 [Coniella lustricola]|uniref:Uncharacterized protein n=1 Tax=Coniella lustricola TaxID=2025994 RepID=A0A2T3AEI3_9PEZI|nr:hypothetical protein BD289DRAFT_158679 [Coniella lustricola]
MTLPGRVCSLRQGNTLLSPSPSLEHLTRFKDLPSAGSAKTRCLDRQSTTATPPPAASCRQDPLPYAACASQKVDVEPGRRSLQVLQNVQPQDRSPSRGNNWQDTVLGTSITPSVSEGACASPGWGGTKRGPTTANVSPCSRHFLRVLRSMTRLLL